MPMHPDYRRKVMNLFARGDAFTPPTTYWLGLHNTTLSTSTLPTTATEIARANAYTRMPVTTGMLSSATTANSTVHLTTGVQWPDPLANWSSAKGLAWYDSSVTSGAGASTCCFFGDLVTPLVITGGNPVRLSSGTTLGGSVGLS